MKNSPQKRTDILQERFALNTVSRLSEATAVLPHDISERLRAARAQALARRKMATAQTASQVVNTGAGAALTWHSDEGLNGWSRLGSVLALVALVVGLLAINSWQGDHRIEELAEIDSALLTDELPPAAFADPGFVQFLKAPPHAAATP